jgi:hypothetical protein
MGQAYATLIGADALNTLTELIQAAQTLHRARKAALAWLQTPALTAYADAADVSAQVAYYQLYRELHISE